jgi:hypothetical protein
MNQQYKPLTKEEYHSIQKGDIIERMLAFSIPMEIVVQSVNEDTIDAGWIFHKNTGIEIDEDISVPVSYISKIIKRAK